MQIKIGPDLSVQIVEGNTLTYAGHLFTLAQQDPKLFAQITTEHLAEAAEKYPELKPAIEEFARSAGSTPRSAAILAAAAAPGNGGSAAGRMPALQPKSPSTPK